MTPEEFRKQGHEIVDWIADYRARVGELPVMSSVAPGSIRARLPAAPPTAPCPDISDDGPLRNSTRSRLNVSMVSAVKAVGPVLMPL